ncbi:MULTISPECIES: hypothetical protein [unclassified Mesorhizobium]|uniref:hypothetical protein n=1 Tax=unclassified Mesorhizobium TaxID=325217 RepID=UPI00112B3638|nr:MULTISPECIES: hypothetical protein [unclassified Mesorhizobium]TPK92233.1 hypothetical protein FJ567_27995 [Mesorhizobium sp. B2-4-16]TPL70626.1 hypothetical protein FJ956_15735 [Mesorhizobium sp. B2-4-3]
MKLFVGLVASVALFGGARFLPSGNDQIGATEVTPANVYRLIANGDEAACAIHRGAEVSEGLSLLSVAPNCRKLMPGIERVKFWREQPDGSVAFSENGVDPIVTFGVADGDGYESYAPAAPLLALTGNDQ